MPKTPRLDSPRRREYDIRCTVADNLIGARLTPKVGLPLSYRAAAKAMRYTVSAQAIEKIEKGAYLPRYRKALKMLKWIRMRLGIDEPKETP